MRRAFFFAPAAVMIGLTATSVAQPPALDPRTAIVVPAPQKAFILSQMRQFVGAVQRIADGLATGDKAKVVEAARSRGLGAMRAMTDKPVGLENSMPAQWKSFGHTTHQGFDEIAEAAEQNKLTAEILALLAATMKNCIACHQTFRLVEGEAPRR